MKTNLPKSSDQYFKKSPGETEGLGVNVKKMKMIFSSENVGKVTEGEKFVCAICRKITGSNFILYN